MHKNAPSKVIPDCSVIKLSWVLASMSANWPIKLVPNLTLISIDTGSAARLFPWKCRFFLIVLQALMAMALSYYCSIQILAQANINMSPISIILYIFIQFRSSYWEYSIQIRSYTLVYHMHRSSALFSWLHFDSMMQMSKCALKF